MFIAHLPAGYLLTRFIQRQCNDKRRSLLLTGLIASIIPDIDLIHFYLFDDRLRPHHTYLTHAPLFWVASAIMAVICFLISGKKHLFIYVAVAFAGVMLHMALDSITAEIRWFYPFSNWELNLVKVPAHYSWWVWNFVLHWTFLLEIGIIITALTIWFRECRKTY